MKKDSALRMAEDIMAVAYIAEGQRLKPERVWADLAKGDEGTRRRLGDLIGLPTPKPARLLRAGK